MEDYRNQIQQHLRTVREMISGAVYYKYHRSEWDKDKSADCISLAEENLKQAEKLLGKL